MRAQLLTFTTLLITALGIGGLLFTSQAPQEAENAFMCNVFVEAYVDGGATEAVVCEVGDQVSLFGDVTGNSFGYRWEPANLLDDPNSQFPTATVFETTTFTLTVSGFNPNAPNLVTNGDFSQLTVGIDNTGYSYQPNVGSQNQEVYGEGEYSIATSGNQVHPDFRNCSDPDGATSNMMIVNGAGTVTDVWCQNISVTPGNSYNFSAWVVSMVGGAPATLQFTVNGQQVGSPLSATPGFCDWQQFSGDWYNESSFTATLCIRNQTTALSGNDFAIDNIEFLESCEETAELTIYVLEDPEINAPELDCNDPMACVQPSLQMANNFDFAEYDWFVTSGNATITSGENTATPTICGSGNLTLALSRFVNNEACVTFHDLTIGNNGAFPPSPIINGETEFCPGEASFAVTPNAAYTSYAWNFPDGGSAVGPANEASVTADFTTAPDNGRVCLTVFNTCGRNRQRCINYSLGGSDTTYRDSTVCEIIGPGSIIDTIPNATGCDEIIITNLILGIDTIRRGASSCSPLDIGMDTSLIDGGVNCDTVLIVTTELSPPDTLRAMALTCIAQDTGVVMTTLPGDRGCDTILLTTFEWNRPDTIRLTAETCMPQDTGTFESLIAGPDGCDTILITGVELTPRVTLFDTTFACMILDTGTVESTIPGVLGCDTTLFTTILWDRPDTTFATALTCIAQDTGVFESLIAGPEGCDTILLTQIDWDRPDTTFATALTCIAQDTGVFESLIAGPEGCDTILLTQIDWDRPDTTFATALTCIAQDTGVFESLIAGPEGCDTILLTQVNWDRPDTTFATALTCIAQDTGVFESLIAGPEGCDTILLTQIDWDRPDTTFATALTCIAQDTGVFESLIAGPEGCDTILLTQIDWDRPDTTFATALTCIAQDTGVFESLIAGPEGCDTILLTQIDWDRPDTTFATALTCIAQDTGVFESLIAGPEGCDTILLTQIDWDRPDTTFATALTCIAQDTGVFESLIAGPEGCDTILLTQVNWDRPDTTFATALTCIAQDTGVFESLIAGPEGCDTILLTQIDWDRPDTTFATALTCIAQDTGLFESLIAGPEGCDTILLTQIDWDRPDTTFATALTCIAQDTGVFESLIAGPEGCDTILLTQIDLTEPDTLRLTATSCDPIDIGESAVTTTDNAGCMLVTITQTNLVAGGVGREQVFSCDPATVGFDTLIIATATCDSLHIIETYGNPPVSFNAISQAVSCGNGGGIIQVPTVSGGSGAYTYRINTGSEQTSSTFFGLSPGRYTVFVTDSDGCSSQQDVFINESLEPAVSLGEDRTIVWGDSVQVFLQYSGDFMEANSIAYSDALCLNCQERWFAPRETTTYGVTVRDTFGCIATDQFRITVEQPEGIYVPNAFSPNGDGINDLFIVNGDPSMVSRISGLMIFNRWGEAIFMIDETPVNNPAGGWDGMYRGEELNGGVFVYTFVAHYVDGSEKRFQGEVILLK